MAPKQPHPSSSRATRHAVRDIGGVPGGRAPVSVRDGGRMGKGRADGDVSRRGQDVDFAGSQNENSGAARQFSGTAGSRAVLLVKQVLISFLVALAPPADDEPLYSLSVTQNVLNGNGNEAFGHCGLCFLKRNGRPFACYALHKKARNDTRFAFLLLFSPAGKGPVMMESSSADDREMMLKGKLTLGGSPSRSHIGRSSTTLTAWSRTRCRSAGGNSSGMTPGLFWWTSRAGNRC